MHHGHVPPCHQRRRGCRRACSSGTFRERQSGQHAEHCPWRSGAIKFISSWNHEKMLENTYVGLVEDGGRLERSQRRHGASLDGAASAAEAGTADGVGLQHYGFFWFGKAKQMKEGFRRFDDGKGRKRRNTNWFPVETGALWFKYCVWSFSRGEKKTG